MNRIKIFEQFLLERSKNDPMPEVYQDKKLAIFLVGAPASGKSWYLNKEILRKNRHFKIIDPDAKSNLLTKHLHKLENSFKDRVSYHEYVNTITNRVEVFPRIRGLNREIEMQFEILLHEGTNIIYDSTGNNTKLLTYLIDKCNELDYDVIFLQVMGKNLDWQLQQSQIRANKTGRPVDEDYLKYLYKNSQNMMKYYSSLDIKNYYVLWNRGIELSPKWFKYENGELLRKSGHTYKPVIKSTKVKSLSESFEFESSIHAFDMDDTLLETPKFSDFFKDGKLPSPDSEMGIIIDNELSKYGLSRNDVIIEDNRITIDGDKSPDIWEKNIRGRGILPKPDEFYYTKVSLGVKPYKKIKDIFDSVENQTIITGRNENLRTSIENHLYELNLYPNQGVNLCPSHINGSLGIAKWKSSVLEELCSEYDMVYFYEDKLSWILTIRQNIDCDNLIIYHVRDGEIIKEY